MHEMILQVDLSGCWLGKLKGDLDLDISLIDTIPLLHKPSGVQDLVDIDLNGNDPELVMERLRSMNDVEFVSSPGTSGSKLKLIVGTSSCLGCRALSSAEAFLLSAKVLDDGWVEWRVVHDKKEALGNLLKRLDGTGMKYRVLEEREFKNLDSLTKEQERVLKAALDMGYYNFPKDVGVRELALKLGVSTAYISYTLRSAQKKVIQLYLKR